MENLEFLLDRFKQNEKLPIRIISPGFGHLSSEEASKYDLVHHAPYYFFLFMLEGVSHHKVDLQSFEIGCDELLFVLPHQLHELPDKKIGTDYFKIGFDESCLSRLPKQYPFLINSLNQQKIHFNPSASVRLKSIFEILLSLLSSMETEAELILAHLSSLLTEINTAYFSEKQNPADEKLSKYIDFKVFVEDNFTNHPNISHIAEALAINTNGLYKIVKHYSGLSPKEFILNRLILEARRRLYYKENSSIKTLAFELGFNDPEYFSRLFKKLTGKTIAAFFKDLSGK